MSEYICELTPIDSETWETTIGEEIVRCRDCKHHAIYETWNPKGETHHCNSFGQDIDADGFCAWGERK